ncbi:DUF3795 domain-containing protein [Thermodesulfobacteriota bacterium]
MDYFQMTAPCGLDCFNCHFFLAHENQEAMIEVEKLSEEYNITVEIMLCSGCREHNGQIWEVLEEYALRINATSSQKGKIDLTKTLFGIDIEKSVIRKTKNQYIKT